MRIRLPFAGVFFLLLLLAGYAGLTSLQVDAVVNDKVLHFFTFFLLTVVFYWILDTNRRRTLNLTLVTCTLVLGVGSEFLQGLLPNDREFDLYDLVANVVGSLAGLGLCSLYHKRMLERKRLRRGYNAVNGEDTGGPEDDVELGDLVGGEGGHEEGVTDAYEPAPSSSGPVGERGLSLEEEVDNWDENATDAWDEGDGDIGDSTPSNKGKGKEVENGEGGDTKKRAD